MFIKKPLITSFSEITLTVSGMRFAEEYVIKCNGSKTDISHYAKLFINGEDKRELKKSVTVATDLVITELNNCGVMRWDGFRGKNPPGVLDGYMFSFDALVNDGAKIYASGSNNYPRHYREFRDWLYKVLNE